MEAAIDHTKQSLECAFDDFNRVSEDLTHVYSQLEKRVEDLQKELAITRDDKFHQLIEKEKLADRLTVLLRTLPVGVIVLDDYGKIIEHNKIAGELIGTNLNNKQWCKVAEKYLAPGYSGNTDICLKNGNHISLKIEDQQRGEGKIIILTDVTEQLSFSESVSRKERLEALGNMVASLAHQVRTPLTAAFLYTSSLERRTKKQDLSYQLLENIKHSLHSLEKTVNDMLSYAKGEWELTDLFSLEALVKNIRKDIDTEFGQHLVDLKIFVKNSDTEVSINYIAFWGAIKNVVHNAIQASDYDTKVMVEVSLEGSNILFSIRDRGDGVPDELKEKIFQPFFTTKAGGTGLGLAIVKSVVTAHQGTIEAVDENPHGTCINLRIPKFTKFMPISSSSA